MAKFDQASWPLQQHYYKCPASVPEKYTLVLKGKKAYGQSGNRLRSFLRAVQYARDRDRYVQLGVMHDSWAMETIGQFFVKDNRDWTSLLEQSLCIRILKHIPEHRVIHKTPRELFLYKSKAPKQEHVASQLHIMRTLFQHCNTGVGHNGITAVKDMCSGLDDLFTTANDTEGAGGGGTGGPRSSPLYSAIHLRSFEGQGKKVLAKMANRTGCDRKAANEMKPEYIKSILAPMGMLAHPIVVISDNQPKSNAVLMRLMGDPELRPMIRVVPEEARWIGGDMTLAVMANMFIGNPASSMSGFIARSRVALGFGHSNYMHLAKDESGKWTRVYRVFGGDKYPVRLQYKEELLSP